MQMRMTTLTDRLLATADAYRRATGLSLSRVSTLVFGDGGRLDGIVAGKDLNTRSYEKAMAWFDANWPAGADWPADVERPSSSSVAAE